MSAHRTVLFHPLNHIGLGHINRLSVIARALQQIDPTVRTPFVVEGASHVLLDALALPYVPLPSGNAMSDRNVWAMWSERECSEAQVQIARSIFQSLNPQVVVFDCLPSPYFSEAVVESGIPIVLCLREMRDLGRYLAHVSSLLNRVNLILVPHAEGAFSLPQELMPKSCFVGQIARAVLRVAPRVRDLQRPQVVVTAGGGGYPGTVEFYNLAMHAIADLRQNRPGIKAQLITGPLFREECLLRRIPGIQLTPFDPDIAARFRDSDLVICQAGYNTVSELEHLGTRTILVPAEREWDDQFARADRVSRERKNFRVFRGKTATELSSLVSELLGEDISSSDVPEFLGGMNAAQLIYEML
jgi:predicted glycosyltransferase